MTAPTLSPGDTAWLLTASTLVMLMTVPGLAFFYAGLVRRKNVISTMMYSFLAYAIVSIIWILYAFSLAFSPYGPLHVFIGDLKFAAISPFVGVKPSTLWIGTTVPAFIYCGFQLTFAAITVAIISSAIVERTKLSAWVLFCILWLTFVYCPVAHWLWSDGWPVSVLPKIGLRPALDFAGGMVVHMSSGFSALVLAYVIGRRLGYGREPMPPHNITYVLLGMALLWFGWFGFNAGSAVAANGLAASAWLVTNTATAAAAITWCLLSWIKEGKASSLAFASGAVAGLVAITPASGFVDPLSAIVIGVVASIISYHMVEFRIKRGLDESLDAWAVHGMSGFWGSIATGLFANPKINPGNVGLIYGLIYGKPLIGALQLASQIVTSLAVLGYVVCVTFIIAKIIDKVVGWRVPAEMEYVGLDMSVHGEEGYIMR
ncbi:MAG: ammonium transporter [Crenarchaeota archaeon]|nr:ammonium transporter [Thermoproteota archaeon]